MNNLEESLKNEQLLQSIKQQKEHMERSINVLLGQFEGDNQYFDQLRLLGSKYHTRINDFENLKVENAQLKIEMRNMQEQLNRMRFSNQDTLRQEIEEDFINRVSIDRKPESTFNMITTQLSGRESMKSRMTQIQALKKVARAQESERFDTYDQLFKQVLHFLEMIYNTRDLVRQMKEVDKDHNQAQMVLVPRHRYEKLIEIYALNMADVSVKALEQQLSVNSEHVKGRDSTLQGYKEKYQNIIREQDIEVGSLQIFFQRLAQKFGFEKQWERYHLHNSQEAVKLKAQLEQIVNPKVYGPPSKASQNEKQEKEGQDKAKISDQLRRKVDSLMSILPFEKREKDEWKEFSEKYRQDKLLSMSYLFNYFEQRKKQHEDQLFRLRIEMLSTLFSKCVKKFDEFLIEKYKSPILIKRRFEKIYAEDTLRKKFQAKKLKDLDLSWDEICKTVTSETFHKIFHEFRKSMVFVSQGEVYEMLVEVK